MRSFVMNFMVVATSFTFATTTLARDNVQIAGSSTVLPYANIVAEQFGKKFDFPTPVVEGGGSSAGLKQFCQGSGENTIDIANSSRPIKEKELAECEKNGVTALEIKFGYDGIVFATSVNDAKMNLTSEDLYKALNANSKAVNWSDVNPDLPNTKILVFIPGEKHGTREVFEEKVLKDGCKKVDPNKDKKECVLVRKDGVAVDIDGDYTETLARIKSNPESMGVFGLSFYENNTDVIQVATFDGVEPNVETIASGEYPVSRPLFFYVKMQHVNVIPGLKEYVNFFINPKMLGPDGPLVEYGLVPLSEEELEKLNEVLN